MFFCGGSQSCFILWPREKDVVLFYEWPQGSLNVLETLRVCPLKQRILFVWFLLFPLDQWGKQSLTIKQTGIYPPPPTPAPPPYAFLILTNFN